MAFEKLTLPPGVSFSAGSSQSNKPRVLASEFGDGYVQRVADGLNSDLSTLSVRFDVLRHAEGETIVSFFSSKRGAIPFKFAIPGEIALRKWIAPEWSRDWQGGEIVAVNASWQEVADPE